MTPHPLLKNLLSTSGMSPSDDATRGEGGNPNMSGEDFTSPGHARTNFHRGLHQRNENNYTKVMHHLVEYVFTFQGLQPHEHCLVFRPHPLPTRYLHEQRRVCHQLHCLLSPPATSYVRLPLGSPHHLQHSQNTAQHSIAQRPDSIQIAPHSTGL